MMKKTFLLGIIYLLSCLCAEASVVTTDDKRSDANIFGHVLDGSTKEHLPYITIFLEGTGRYSSTDASGHYFLKDLPEGTHTIVASAVGYKSQRKRVSLQRNVTVELNFELEIDRIALGQAVISADRRSALRRLYPNLINVIDSRLMESTNACCLADGLNFQPGVRVEDNCQNCGFTQVRINGLDGHYSLILIDSRPIFSSLAGVYGLEQIPANMIERVEVTRGGGSALYGSAAIGGVVNIITKEPVRNSADFSHTLMAVGGRSALDNISAANISLVTDDNKAGIYLYGQVRNRGGYDHDGDGYTELPVLGNQTFGLRSFYRLSANARLTAQFHNIHEYRRGGNMLDQAPHEANIAEQLEHDMKGGGLSYDFFAPSQRDHVSLYFSFQDAKRKSYYGGTGEAASEADFENARRAYGRTSDLTLVSGASYRHSFQQLLFMPAHLTLGAEFNYDVLYDRIPGYDREMEQKMRIETFLFQNEWKNDYLSILVGGRVDRHNLIGKPVFVPRLNLRFTPSEAVALRASYAAGYRAPQAFDEDLHVALVGGERVVTILAEDLRRERSHSLSASADLRHVAGRWQTYFLMEGFFTRLIDILSLKKLSEPDKDGNLVQMRYNASGAKVAGATMELGIDNSKWLSLQGGLTFQKSLYDEPVEWDEEAPKERRMLKTPNLYGYVASDITPFRDFSISLSGNYTGSMLAGHAAGSGVEKPIAVETPSFLTVNVKLTYSFRLSESVRLQLNGGVQNLFNAFQKDFDKGWNRDSNYIYGPSLPRSLFLGAKLML